MSLFDFSGRQISGFAPGSHFGDGQARGFPTKPGPGRPSQMAPQFQPPMQIGQYPSKPGPGRPSQMSPPSQQKPRTGAQAPFARYAPGTDMSQVQRTDTMQPNPLYKPGAASPVPPPSYGTPYGQPMTPGLMPKWAQEMPILRTGPAPADPRMQGFMDANPNMGVQEFLAANPGYNFRLAASRPSPQADGNLAYAAPDQRPQPFTQSMNFMGQPVDPGQFYGQRDAFIQNINQAKQPFAMNPAAGRPKMDFGGMWNQAGDMVQGGWQNPLAGMLR